MTFRIQGFEHRDARAREAEGPGVAEERERRHITAARSRSLFWPAALPSSRQPCCSTRRSPLPISSARRTLSPRPQRPVDSWPLAAQELTQPSLQKLGRFWCWASSHPPDCPTECRGGI
eukprot:2627233-Prymnesium_polylepis.1